MRTGTFGPSVALACAALLVGCSGPGEDGTPAPASDSTQQPPGPGEYLAGRAATVDRPEGAPDAVVVLVPGGGWSSADPTGLRPLAETLLRSDLAVVTITYGTAEQGDYYPGPVNDVACAVAFAAQEVPDVPVVLVGHSAGAHLVAVVGLVPDGDDPGCPYPRADADAVVGLAGPYDVTRVGGLAERLFDVPLSEEPSTWSEGNPHTWVAERPDLPFLLVHGDADAVVPLVFTEDLAAALADAGHPVTTQVLADVGHNDIYRPEVIADTLVRWIDATVTGGPA